jgi:hypothetical protein
MVQTFKLGRKRPVVVSPRLHLRNYLYRNLPKPPASCDYTSKGRDFLSSVLANDKLGDCTAAGAFHIGGTFLSNADLPVPFTVDDCIKFYSATTGYEPSKPDSDQGGEEQTVLAYWQAHGLKDKQHRIAGWAAVDGANQVEIKTAIWLFENVYFGVELPDAWVRPFPQADGFVWDLAGNPNQSNGHCFVGLGYNDQGVIIDTWGMLGIITWKAIEAYATGMGSGELYTVFGTDSIAKATGKAPNDFDLKQLTADLQAIKPVQIKNLDRKAHAFVMYGLGGATLDPSYGEAYLVQRIKALGVNTHASPYQYYDTQTIANAVMAVPKGDAIVIGGDSLGANDGPLVAQGLIGHHTVDFLFGFQPSLWGRHVQIPANVTKALCIWNSNWFQTVGLGAYEWVKAPGNNHTILEIIDRHVAHPGDSDMAMQNIVLNHIKQLTG